MANPPIHLGITLPQTGLSHRVSRIILHAQTETALNNIAFVMVLIHAETVATKMSFYARLKHHTAGRGKRTATSLVAKADCFNVTTENVSILQKCATRQTIAGTELMK